MRMLSSESYYGADGKPANTASGYSTVKYKYNKQNQLTETACYGAGGRPVDNSQMAPPGLLLQGRHTV